MNSEPITWTAWYLSSRDDIGIALGAFGIILSFVGFWIAFVQIRKTRSAADAAKAAATEARNAIARMDTIMDFSSIITLMTEIKQHQRSGIWHILPEKYATLRQKLIGIKTNVLGLSQEDKEILTGSILQFKTMERKIEKSIHRNTDPTDVARMNEIVADQIDNLTEILARLRYITEESKNG